MVKTAEEIMQIRIACRICREILLELGRRIGEGLTTGELEEQAACLMKERGVRSAFKGYRGYPGILCISINEEVVHGIPSPRRKICSGDLVSVDIGVVYKGYYGDCADTFLVGEVSPARKLLVAAAHQALEAGIGKAVPGNRVGDISRAIQETVEKFGFSVVRDFSGHGIGRSLHEPPEVPNFGVAGHGHLLEENMVLAIEPMVNEGSWAVQILSDGWTAVTADRSCSAHVEDTVLVRNDRAEILTAI